MKATDVLVQCLENEGVEYIFGIVGKETLDFVESISRSAQIQFVPVRHEQAAAFMAGTYGKLTGKPGVCTATLGPGTTNLLTGLGSALLDLSPVIAITGQAGLDRQYKRSHQLLNLIKMSEPVTKWSVQIKDATTIPEIVRKSFQIAIQEKPGPVLIELPENIAMKTTTAKVIPVTSQAKSDPCQRSIQAAISLIHQSIKPFIVIGNEVVRQNAVLPLLDFIQRLQAPVVHSFMAKGIVEKDDPYNFYTFGFEENDMVVSGMGEADLLIVIGLDFVESLPKNWNKGKIPVLHISSLVAEVDEYYPIQGELIGHVGNSLELLNKQGILSKEWLPSGNLKTKIMQTYHIFPEDKEVSHLPLNTEHILHIVEKISSDETILISDVGAHKLAIARTYQPKLPGNVLISNGFASMGVAVPWAMGARMANRNDPIIGITGDGGALMNIAELETAKRLGLSFIMIVIRDDVLKLEEQMMNKKFGHSDGVTFGNPDFVRLAESFGIKGVRAETLDKFEEIMYAELQSQKELVLIELPLRMNDTD
ncbi:acetolactate synthase large subunit [Bacillus sp. FJAT-50079]|uniref:acetolactate synthase large subunit n=1 Tax=Bacillus sp. FJAT-50079 TaxID=2833577 RepID=UPI001BC93D49|nr:acetolactate synthase large subunit [Bacillus sp. FJAT-50079]MBS4206909.1 acetolactate synthase large subunit [Bacillus sp. FJAT-50079]